MPAALEQGACEKSRNPRSLSGFHAGLCAHVSTSVSVSENYSGQASPSLYAPVSLCLRLRPVPSRPAPARPSCHSSGPHGPLHVPHPLVSPQQAGAHPKLSRARACRLPHLSGQGLHSVEGKNPKRRGSCCQASLSTGDPGAHCPTGSPPPGLREQCPSSPGWRGLPPGPVGGLSTLPHPMLPCVPPPD